MSAQRRYDCENVGAVPRDGILICELFCWREARVTRLRPYTTVLPKPLMPVGDRPIMDVIVRQLRHAGVARITVATGYLAELIEVFFGDGSKYGIPIDYFREDEPLGTAGALR